MIKLFKIWILGSAACVAAGWILSALHQLNLAGYAVYFAILIPGLAIAYKFRHRKNPARRAMAGANWARKNLRRFRRPLPLLFLLTAALAITGGALHAPNNYDALTYRFPRVLHWWSESGWHWIATPDERLNLSGTVFEWLMMPMFVLTHSDRFFFLINIVGYLLLPGLVFVTFVAGGLGRQAAWFWMWLMPAALCYAMQAGSISNDTIAATYFLAAVYFAFQARRTGDVHNLWLAFLAGGLLTGVKGSNLPLILPVAAAIWPAMRLAEKRFASSLAVLALSLLVSYLPTAAMNLRHTGDWAGDPHNLEKNKVEKPLAGILGNGLQLGLQSLEPPFLPLARNVEIWVWDRFPEKLQTVLRNDFPRFVVGFRELPQEESAGVGIGITVIALVSIVAAWRFRRRNPVPPIVRARPGMVVGVLTWVALLVYMAKLGSEATSRLISAYYPLLLLPLLLNPAQNFLARQRWYNALAVCAGSIALMAVILTPSRPLWPAGPFFDWAVERFPNNGLLAHAKTVYTVYRARSDLFAALRRKIPESVHDIGVIEGSDDTEASLWRPFGTRRVVHVSTWEHSRNPDLRWFVVNDRFVGQGSPEAFDQWLQHGGGTLVARQTLIEKVGRGLETWSVVCFPNAPN
jgi:hypothetical protein